MAKKRRNNKKWLWWGGGLIIVAIIVAVGVVIWQNDKSDDGSNNEETSEVDDQNDNKDNDNNDENTSNNSQSDLAEEVAEEKRVKQYEGDNPNESNELGGVVSYAGVENGTLVIRTNIDQFLNEGTCELSIVRGGSTVYSSTAGIVADVSTSTCNGFDIPVSKIGTGSVEIVIQLKSGGKSGVIRGAANV